MIRAIRPAATLALLCACAIMTACATAPADKGTATPDPLEPLNRAFFTFNDTLDKAILGPVSRGYTKVTPSPAQQGINNFFGNLATIETIINNFLQGKIEDAFEDIERIVFNATFGLGGLVDFAGKVGFEHHDEDFGQTLAVWGVGPGIYLELPFFGPNTLRDGATIPVSTLADPLFYTEAAVGLSAGALRLIDKRAQLESVIRIRDQTALDPYIFQRDAYLQRRRSRIYDGNPPLEPMESLDDFPPPQ